MDSARGGGPEAGAEFEQLASAWLFTHRSWNTRVAYEADLAQFAAWCATTGQGALGAREVDVARYRDDCVAAGSSPATVSRRLAALTSFFAYAGESDDVNPAEAVERPATATTVTAVLDRADTAALLAAADATGAKAGVLVRLLMLDGIKLGEALGADTADFGDPPPTLVLRRRGRTRSAPLCDDTATAIRRYLDTRVEGPLLCSDAPSRNAARLTRFGADYLVKHVARRAGITTAVSANTLRRRYVTDAHESGRSIAQIQASLGHADQRTTRRLLPAAPGHPEKGGTNPCSPDSTRSVTSTASSNAPGDPAANPPCPSTPTATPRAT